jgi:hypothetical protein
MLQSHYRILLDINDLSNIKGRAAIQFTLFLSFVSSRCEGINIIHGSAWAPLRTVRLKFILHKEQAHLKVSFFIVIYVKDTTSKLMANHWAE